MTRRILQINELIRREVGKIMHEEIDNSRFQFVTIVNVDTSPDLKNTTISLSYIGDQKHGEAIKRVLKEYLFVIQKRLNRTLEMRSIPKIGFELDYSARHAQRIERLIKESKNDQSSL